MDLGIVQRLIGVIDRFGVDPASVVGIILDLDRQIAADGFDEHAVLDRHVRMGPVAVRITCRPLPPERMLRRLGDFVVGSVVDVTNRVGRYDELERFDIAGAFTDLKHKMHVGSVGKKPSESRVFVKPIKFVKISDKAIIVDQIQRRFVEIGAVQSKRAKHVSQFDFGLQSELDVVPEQQHVTDADQIPRRAVVRSGDAGGGQQFGGDVAEDLAAFGIKFFQTRAKLRSGFGQTAPQNVIRSTRQIRRLSHVRKRLGFGGGIRQAYVEVGGGCRNFPTDRIEPIVSIASIATAPPDVRTVRCPHRPALSKDAINGRGNAR